MATGEDQGDVMGQAQRMWSMLDDMAENDPATYRNFIDKQMKARTEYLKPPQPNMCVETKLSGPKQKPVTMYINVFSWQHVPEPKSDEAPIPVIGTAILNRMHEEGNEYKLTNVAFSPKICQDYGLNAKRLDEQQCLINLALDYIQDQNCDKQVTLSRQYNVLGEDVLCKGDLDEMTKLFTAKKGGAQDEIEEVIHNIGNGLAPVAELGNKSSLINEISNLSVGGIESNNSNHDSGHVKITGLNKKTMKNKLIEEIDVQKGDQEGQGASRYNVELKDAKNGQRRKVSVKIHLPEVNSVQECQLDVSQEDLTVKVRSEIDLKINFPEKIVVEEASAKFSKKTNVLTVTAPTMMPSVSSL